MCRFVFCCWFKYPFSRHLHLSPVIPRTDVLGRIENIVLGIVTSLSKNEAPVLALPNRSSWVNVR